jgi:Ca2+-binding RTX toxin-like protein
LELYGGSDRLHGGCGNDVLRGDGLIDLNAPFSGGRSGLQGGDDLLNGGHGADVLWGDGTARGAVGRNGSIDVTGGDDSLFGGGGNDLIYGDGSVIVIEADVVSGRGEILGGSDRIAGGTGNDVLWGDGSVEVAAGGTGQTLGGADVFVFAACDGRDRIADFRAADGDRIDLVATGLAWADLDGNRDGRLDAADVCAAAGDGGLVLDLGAAAGASAAGLNTLALDGVASLAAGDFLFA